MKITKPEDVKIGQIWEWTDVYPYTFPLDRLNPHNRTVEMLENLKLKRRLIQSLKMPE